MVFNGLPEVFEDRVHDAEIYMLKRIYDSLQFLTILPMVQNKAGLFSNYIHGDVDVGKPMYTNNGVNFNQIKFAQGKATSGQTLPAGYMYHANTRNKEKGTYESDLLSFYNAAVVQFADYYEEQYANAIVNGGRVSTAELAPWDTAENVIDNEITLDDEMRYNAKDDRTGYAPNTAIVSRKTKLIIDRALRKEDYESNWNYVASNKLEEGDFCIFDRFNPGATIQKYANPEYSIVQALVEDGVTKTEEGEPIPKAFINVDVRSNKPQTEEHYVWAESNVNIHDKNGFLIIRA